MVAACIEQGRAPPIARILEARYDKHAVLLITHCPHTGEKLKENGYEYRKKVTAYRCAFASGATLWLGSGLVNTAYREAVMAYRATWTLAGEASLEPEVVRAWLDDAQILGRTDGAPEMTIDSLVWPFGESSPPHYSCLFKRPPSQPTRVKLYLHTLPPPEEARAEEAKRRRLVYAPTTYEETVEKVRVSVAPAKERIERVTVPVSFIINSPVAAYVAEARRFEEEEAKVVYDHSWDTFDPDA